MGGWHPSRLVESLIRLPTAWLILWLGLVGLSIALLVLTRTRWGQSQPLRKCVVLSLLAHVLFACFATTVKLVSDTSTARNARPMAVQLAMDEEADSLAEQPVEQRPWDTPTSEAPDLPAMAAERQASSDHTPERPAPPIAQPKDAAEPGWTTNETPAPVPEPDATQLAANHEASTPAAEPASNLPDAQAAERQEDSPLGLPEPSDVAAVPFDAPSPTLERQVPRTDTALQAGPPRLPPQLAEPEPHESLERALAADEDLAGAVATPAPASSPDALELPATDQDQRLASVREARLSQTADAGEAAAAQPVVRSAGPPPLPSVYRGRAEDQRQQLAAQRGGGADTEAAVAAALVWLAEHQQADGRWDADRHGAGREQRVLGHDRSGAGVRADTGITGLALLAFLGAGHTHTDGPYADHVKRGLSFLMTQQRPDGDLAGQASLFARTYCHSMATFALSEALALSGDERLHAAVSQAANYSVQTQDPTSGGWRYRPRDAGDTSQLGWQLMALRSASLAGVPTPSSVDSQVNRFLGSVTAGRFGGLARYRPGQAVSRTMTAEALYCHQLQRNQLSPTAVSEATAYLLGELPGASRPNLYYWYYATLALYNVGGEPWARWNRALKSELIAAQSSDGQHSGSWSPETVWGGYGGRVYSTAMAAMCLEVYYRYLPTYANVARRPERPVDRY